MTQKTNLPLHSRTLLTSLLMAGLTCTAMTASSDSQRPQEIAECRTGEISTWNDGLDRPASLAELIFAYDPSHTPARFAAAEVSSMVAKAAAAWAQCGIPTRVLSQEQALASGKTVIWVQWNEVESRGNFGLSNLGRHTLSLSEKAFDALHAANPGHDARETLQMVISHEMGHHYGLMAHSRRCVDVLSYYHNGKGEQCFKRNPLDTGGVVEYRHNLPTACDIQRCRMINNHAAQ